MIQRYICRSGQISIGQQLVMKSIEERKGHSRSSKFGYTSGQLSFKKTTEKDQTLQNLAVKCTLASSKKKALKHHQIDSGPQNHWEWQKTTKKINQHHMTLNFKIVVMQCRYHGKRIRNMVTTKKRADSVLKQLQKHKKSHKKQRHHTRTTKSSRNVNKFIRAVLNSFFFFLFFFFFFTKRFRTHQKHQKQKRK